MLNTPENTPPAPNLGNLATSPAQTLSDAEIDAQIEARLAQLRIAAGAVNEADASTSNMPQPTAFAPTKHTLAFSGSGSEYFRIWIVNLLLTIVTLTLYSPWAKVRKLQYFYRNTTLNAQPFDYHANPWALFKGRLVALTLLGAYTLAGYLGTTATLAFGALIVLIGPWLIWRSLQFRMANTSYRAVRFGFTGSLKGAYWVFGIATIVVVTYLVSIAFVAQLAAEGAGKGKSIKSDFFGFMALFSLVPFLFPWWHQIMKKYQHQHYAWASLNTGFFATVGDFYSRWLKYVGVSFLIGVVFVLFMVLMSTIGLGSVFGNTTQNSTGAISAKMLIIVIFGSLVFLAAYAAFVCLVKAYQNSRFQNMIWNETHATAKTQLLVTLSDTSSQTRMIPALQFESSLKMQPLARTMFVNLMLIVLTLGLYWPFAAIKLAKIKLESVAVTQNQPWSSIAPSLAAGNADGALGSEVQDVFDVDFAL